MRHRRPERVRAADPVPGPDRTGRPVILGQRSL